MSNPVESYASSLNDDERKLLHSSVAFVLRVVAKADSVVDKKEESAADRALDVAREKLGAGFATRDFPDAVKAADHPDWTQGEYLQKLTRVVKRMPADARKIYDGAILELALTIAGASGGVLGFGDKFSVEEKYGVRRLIAAFDLQIEDADLKKKLGY